MNSEDPDFDTVFDREEFDYWLAIADIFLILCASGGLWWAMWEGVRWLAK